MKKFFILFIAFLSFSSLYSKTIEVQNFKDILSHLTPGTVVLLDIDDTLLIPTQMLGCDEWFNYQRKKHIESGFTSKEAMKKSLHEWEAIRYLTSMELPEKDIDQVVKTIQDQGYPVMGLTTQNFCLCYVTNKQLKENNIFISKTAPSKEDHYFNQGELGVLYNKGTLFTSGSPKGTALFTFFKKIEFSPKRIVFINDKETHLKDVEEIAEKNNVEFIGLRYAYADARKKSFRSEIAELQYSHSNLKKLLISDKEAEEILKKESLLQSK